MFLNLCVLVWEQELTFMLWFKSAPLWKETLQRRLYLGKEEEKLPLSFSTGSEGPGKEGEIKGFSACSLHPELQCTWLDVGWPECWSSASADLVGCWLIFVLVEFCSRRFSNKEDDHAFLFIFIILKDFMAFSHWVRVRVTHPPIFDLKQLQTQI